ncbi:hypothetical protein U1Q18_026937 [Sarracenia purpurea var. burkii]
MEDTNLPVVARRIWNVARVMFFMLRKGIAKRKFMVDLNMMMKRGKIAGKALHNLMFHFHHHSSASNRRSNGGQLSSSTYPPQEYEFSCSNTPAAFPFRMVAKRNHQSHFFPCAHASPTDDDDDDDDTVTSKAVKRALEMLSSEGASPAVSRFLQSPAVRDMVWSEMASPALPGFGRTPMVRQLRVTDSPFPLRDVDEDNRVDEAAEEFIVKFYKELRKQNAMDLD